MNTAAFPSLAARSLAGTEFRLPIELPAQRTAVLVAFLQRQQRDIDAWIDALVAAGVPATPRGLPPEATSAVIEVPMLKRRWGPARPLIDGGMAAGIADADINARTWTCYTDVEAFLRRVRQSGTDVVLALVVERDGTIRAQERDRPAPASLERILAALTP